MTKRVGSSILNFFKPQPGPKQPDVTPDMSSSSSACTQFVTDSKSHIHLEAELAAPQRDVCSPFNPQSEGELSESDDGHHVCSPSNPPSQSDAELSDNACSPSTDSINSTSDESANRNNNLKCIVSNPCRDESQFVASQLEKALDPILHTGDLNRYDL